jgi:hypothetical protein
VADQPSKGAAGAGSDGRPFLHPGPFSTPRHARKKAKDHEKNKNFSQKNLLFIRRSWVDLYEM